MLLEERQIEFKAVIFDMDGVLADTLEAYFAAERKALESAGINVSEKFLHSFNGRPTLEMMREAAKISGKKVDVAALYARMEDELMTEVGRNLKPVSGAVEAVKALRKRGLKLAVASSSTRRFVEMVIGKLGLASDFGAVVCFDDVGVGKPDPALFLRAANLLGVRPGECVVIEDAANGVEAARRAGMNCVGYETGRYGRLEAKWIIQDMAKLPRVLSDDI